MQSVCYLSGMLGWKLKPTHCVFFVAEHFMVFAASADSLAATPSRVSLHLLYVCTPPRGAPRFQIKPVLLRHVRPHSCTHHLRESKRSELHNPPMDSMLAMNGGV